MTFARPDWLWLLVPAALCLGFAWAAGRRRRALAAGWPALAARPGRRALKSTCFICAVAALALAGVGPRLGIGKPDAASKAPPRLRLMVVLDCSRSMLARDVPPDRLGAAKRLVLDVLARLPGLDVGLVGFAGRAWLACPPTPDRAGLALFLDGLTPEAAPLGGTDPAKGLEAAGLALAGVRPAAVLLVTDGEATVKPAGQTRTVLPPGVPVYAVAVGSGQPVTVPGPGGEALRDAAGASVAAGVDYPALAALAEATGGAAYRLAPDAPWPAAAIAAALADKSVPADNTPDTTTTDDGALFLALAVALLLADLALPPGRRLAGLLLLASLTLAGPAEAATTAGEQNARGLAAAARGDGQDALAAFLAARARDPDDATILFNIGVAYYRLGRFAESLAAFDRAAAGPDKALAAKARYNQGNAAWRLHDRGRAMAAYEAALILDPADADARANLDWLRTNPSPAPDQDGAPDPDRAGASPDGQGPATDQGNGQAPAPMPGDDGQGETKPSGETASPTPGRAGDKAAEARLPVAGRDGEETRQRRANAPGAADDPVLGRIPDLVGQPVAPVYARPTVEKDW
ncbi:vWA domain-containing protein [Solidesulfovibrio magneticus]|nr:VWA domain-containing protein [Solidesulfovibrio magneticus]